MTILGAFDQINATIDIYPNLSEEDNGYVERTKAELSALPISRVDLYLVKDELENQ
jgi:hypothetical protein